ncbi:carboxypeptidase-like regulatory domain-containing protein [Hymenobacter crusticola]|nr:carboxypeptidase-like regulatory domain-containing protein [Hymenobacter crusticola]
MKTGLFLQAGKRLVASFLFLVLLLGLGHTARAQYQVRGVTLDKETNQPLPFVSIAVKGTTLGTASNENGEFSLSLPSLPRTLIVSEISHVRDTVRVTSADKPLQIALASASITLPEVKVASYAFQLADRAYEQMRKNYEQSFYGKAFYRQVTRIDNEPTEIQEMVWNVKSNNARIQGTSIAQGRYAAKQALMSFKDFSFYTKAYGLYDPGVDSTTSLSLLGPNTVKNYYLEIVGILERGEGGIAEISFETRPEVKNYYAKGTIWVDVDTYKVERFRITTPNYSGKSNNPAFKFKDKELQIDMSFQNTADAASPLDHIKTTLNFVIERPGKVRTKMNVSAFTFFYDTSRNPTNIEYDRASLDTKDLDEIRSVKYDPEFWANNAVVKRTPVEDEVIKSFEEKGAFGTMLPPKPTKAPTRKLQ